MLWWTAIDRAQSRELGLDRLVDLADTHLRPERHPVVLEAVLGFLQTVVRRYATPDQVATLLERISGIARAAVDGGDPALAPGATRAWAATSHDRDALAGWLEQPDVDQEVRWTVAHRLAALGDDSHVAAEQERDRSVSGHHAALAARAAVPTPEAKAEAWALLMGGTLSNHEFPAVAAGFWDWEQAALVEPYVERHLAEGLPLARESGQAMSRIVGRAGFPWLPLPDAARRSLRARLAEVLETEDVPTVLARTWNDALDDLDRVIG